MNTAMVVTWTKPFPGREMQALEYGAEVQEFWSKLAADGTCTVPEMFFGGSGRCIWMIKGDLDTLQAVNAENLLLVKGELLLQDYTYEYMMAGPAADAYLGRYATVAHQLGLDVTPSAVG